MADDLANDLLRGGDEIAEFMFGDRAKRRKVYYMAERKLIPAFRMGDILCARKSTLIDFIARQETDALAAVGSE